MLTSIGDWLPASESVEVTTLGLGMKGEMNSQVRKNQVPFYVAIVWLERKVIGLQPLKRITIPSFLQPSEHTPYDGHH